MIQKLREKHENTFKYTNFIYPWLVHNPTEIPVNGSPALPKKAPLVRMSWIRY